MAETFVLPERFRFDGSLNFFLTQLQDGEEARVTFGPFPVGYPIAELSIAMESQVASAQAELNFRAVLSEKPYHFKDAVGSPIWVSHPPLIRGGPGTTSNSGSTLAPTTGFKELRFSVYRLIPAAFPYIVFMMNGVNETGNYFINVIPGPFNVG